MTYCSTADFSGHYFNFNVGFVFLDYMLVDEQNALCVRVCPKDYYPVNNTCSPCQGPCPKCKL